MPARRVILAGLGDESKLSEEAIRRGWGAAAKAAIAAGATDVVSAMPPTGERLDLADAVSSAVQGSRLASYRFDRHFGSVRKDQPHTEIESLTFWGESDAEDFVRQGLVHGGAIANAVALARDLSGEPGGVLTPERVAEIATDVANEHGLEMTVYGPAELESMGANAILTVGRASATEPQLIHLVYRPENANDNSREIGLVGKCITFDTGGYSLKPGTSMVSMKGDMSGGGAVLGTMSALGALGVGHTVHGVICAAENMIAGDAFRPDDVIVGMNGVTMEIVSTDAEGRLVLADGLVFTARLGVDEMIDLATLTGAKMVALGDETTALFSNNEELAGRILDASKTAGESTWRMPLSSHLEPQIKGTIADIKNTGGRSGGSITAALFLQHFNEDVPWAHLDIAGGNLSKGNAYTPKGATGVGVRTLLSLLSNNIQEPAS